MSVTLEQPATEDQVIKVRELYRDGLAYEKVAQRLGLGKNFVSDILNEEHYRNSPFPDTLIPREEIKIHPRHKLYGYHPLTRTIWSFAKHVRYGRIIGQNGKTIRVRLNGKMVSIRIDRFIKECLDQKCFSESFAEKVCPPAQTPPVVKSHVDVVSDLHIGGANDNDIQRILKRQGVDWSLTVIERICYPWKEQISVQQSGSDKWAEKIIDDILEDLKGLWEKYRLYGKKIPQAKFDAMYPLKDRYRAVHTRICKSNLCDTASLGYDALEYFITTCVERPMRNFWEPLYANWLYSKYPERRVIG